MGQDIPAKIGNLIKNKQNQQNSDEIYLSNITHNAGAGKWER